MSVTEPPQLLSTGPDSYGSSSTVVRGGTRPVVALTATFLIIGGALYLGAMQQAPSAEPREQWFKIVFGLDGGVADWDGRLLVDEGTVLDLLGWGLESVDRLDLDLLSWQIKTGRPAPAAGGRWRPSFPESARGFLVKLRYSSATNLQISTLQGQFTAQVSDLRPGRPQRMLAGRASIEVLGFENRAAASRTQDDFPTLAFGPHGHRHVAWIAYNHGSRASQLMVRDVDSRDSEPVAIAAAGEFSDLNLVGTRDGLRAIWCSPGAHDDWDVYTSICSSAAGWSAAERLTTARGTDFHLSVAKGPAATWIVWQSFRSGNGDIYAKYLADGSWSEEIRVTTDPANEWEPSIDLDSRGRAWIGYDTYRHGNYDVYLQSVTVAGSSASVGDPIPIARSANFEAHASVLADRAGRVWVGYDNGGPNWGRDGGNLANGEPGDFSGQPLHGSRRLELRCLVEGQLHASTIGLPQESLLPAGSRFYEYPQLAEDGDGRLWLFFRMCRQGSLKAVDQGNCWDIFATTYTDGGWLDPIQLPNSEGRQNQRVAIAADASGRLHCAWSEGNHFIVRQDRKYSVRYGQLAEVAERGSILPLKPILVEPPGDPAPAAPRPWNIRRAGEQYQLYFGDLHRHTNISVCLPRNDGCQTDAHRYALDVAALDFLAITDHTHDLDPYAWWRIQLEADRFHIPGRYTPIYAYERSNYPEGGGHRNVYFLERGWEVNGSDYYYRYHPEVKKPNTDPDQTLYPWLKQRDGAFTIAHTPAYSRAKQRGTWDFHDAQVEPVAEIFQGYRQSFERPERSLVEEVSLWYALSKGYRLGFIASSDHQSTHISYACVWATDKSRRALFDAILARRTYAATDRIALDFRIDNTLMGGQTSWNRSKSTLRIRATGTAPIDEVQIIRSGRLLDTLRPNQRLVDIEYTDPHPLPAPCYYYVRVHQTDGNLAWGSPIWIEE